MRQIIEAEVRSKAREMAVHLANVLMESLFLLMWAVPNVYVGRCIGSLHVTGIDAVVLRCLQVLFGVSTLTPICISMYKNLRIMAKRARQEIEAAGAVPMVVTVPVGNGTPPQDGGGQ
jgi:hypothetical protein